MKLLRRILVLAAVLVSLLACKKPEKTIYLTEFHASVEALTKATLDPASGKYSWTEGDQILVKNGKASEIFTYSAGDRFTTAVTDFEATGSYAVLYPASAYAVDRSTINRLAVDVSDTQTYDGEAVEANILYGTSTMPEVILKSLLTTVEVKLPEQVQLSSIKLNAGDTKLAGQASVAAGALTIDGVGVTEMNLSVTSKSPVGSVYFTLPTGLYRKGLTALLTYSDGSTEEMSTEEIFMLSQGVISIKEIFGAPKLFADGDGSVENPYQITNVSEMNALRSVINDPATYASFADKNYKLMNSIDLSADESVVPVGNKAGNAFKGVFDGCGYSLTGFKFVNTATEASGLFGYVNGGTVKNVKLEKVNVDSDYIYSGVVAGDVENATIENIAVDGTFRAYKSGITAPAAASTYAPVSTTNAGYNGTIAGLVKKSTVKDCSFSGTATIYGKFGGGIIGVSYNSTVEKCSVAKGSMIHIYYHYTGGIIGRAIGAENQIKDCSFEGHLASTGYINGGIVGQLLGGKVTGCVFGSNGYVGGDKYFVGGIVGSAQPLADIEISKCASFGEVRGAYSVAGICGYGGPGTGSSDKDQVLSATKKLVIKECGMVDGLITATSGNSNKYPIAAGVIGWTHGGINYTLKSCFSIGGTVQTTYGANVSGVLSGVSAYQNCSGGATMENCYSAFEKSNFLICYDPIVDDNLWYAAVAIRCTGTTAINNCYSSSDLRTVYTSSGATQTGCEQFSQAQMTDGTLLAKLNATGGGVTWVAGPNNYPVPQDLPADPNPKKKAAKRVSVIGDSISTFKGIIPGGYSAHYPATDGTLTLARETYWWRLIYDYMKDAELDVNIAFSGSTVTNTTAENYAARYGTASNAWWHNSYTERFAACGGCGNPDIILIHGGTNDWSHKADPLAPGVAILNESGNIYGGTAPSSEIMNSIYAVADAAKTRAEVNALPDGTFCEAYVKLLCQIRQKYPQCKVVCIIGDYLSQSIEQSILQIAEHYGAKTVNLFRVNGFNDLGGYKEGQLPGLGKPQPNMPKHDHTDLNSPGGCHPGSACMDFMASKIYSELGAWLEQ